MSTLVTEDPSRAHLLRRRFEERSRLAGYQRRLDQIDPARNGRAHTAMEALAEQAADRLAAIEAELTGAQVAAPVPRDIATAEDAREAMRQRLHHLELMLLRVPEECKSAASKLRRAIHTELRRLERGRP
jgi:hypothetical protein